MSAISQALVIGGSLAGLCAAAALARSFDRVVVLESATEPERDPGGVAPPSLPLPWRAQQAMARLVPAAFARLDADGGGQADLGATRWFVAGGWLETGALGLETLSVSRDLLERRLRESCEELDNLELRRVKVVGPVRGRRGIRGVELGDGEIVEAELVIDASSGEHTSAWLSALGAGRVRERELELGLSWVSGVFELPAGERLAEAVVIQPLAPVHRRGGMIVPIEGGRVSVSLFGYHGEVPPTELTELRRWARALLQPQVAQLLGRARLLGQLARHSRPRQLRRAIEGSLRMPRGYLVLGDALCSVDPLLGQDLICAASQAELLLGLEPGANTRRWQTKLARVAEASWAQTCHEAERWRDVGGQRLAARALRWYTAKLSEYASRDAELGQQLVRVLHGVDPAARLFGPAMLRGLARGHVRERGERGRREALPIGISEVLCETNC